ncbi:MAG TPA: oligoendopeptidase F [Candidatus Lokiarchaeia archaeon]|nr:oligoendopeptidase F [Candidatus Lokiarchaeia archaeon]
MFNSTVSLGEFMGTTRDEIRPEDKWDVEAIYESDDLWEQDYASIKDEIPEIMQYKGHLADSPEILKALIEKTVTIDRHLGKLQTYATMRHDEDTRVERYQNYRDQGDNLQIEYHSLASWIIPEILAIEAALVESYVAGAELAPYRFYLQQILRLKPHVLSEPEEKLLSMSAQITIGPGMTFQALNDADLRFGNILKDGNPVEITHAKYAVFIRDPDRSVRQQAFHQYHGKYDEFANTLAALIYNEIRTHVFAARARNYSSTLEARLFDKNIDPSVYMNLIDTVHQRIGSLHAYMAYRKSKMALEELHLYDVYVPFMQMPEMVVPYDRAKEYLLEAVAPLGEDYRSVLANGLGPERWVDIYENENKRSGAHSTGSYDTRPYILMNYNDTLDAARTLAHEAGHSMHTYYTHAAQPPIYGDYEIFLAEVASTFHEALLNQHLMNQTEDASVKAYLLNAQIEEIRTTLFRQTMFAEFELLVNQLVEHDSPLSSPLLKREYRKLNEFYFGPDVVVDPEIEIEWARIPHFYYNYYVYQYSTGISAAIALFTRVMNGVDLELEQYLGFLKAGSSKFALDILRDAGVDMSTPAAIDAAIDYFDATLAALQNLDA